MKDSRPTEDSAAIRRRRVCLTCNFRFTTFERVQLRELVVIKRNGRRVPFDRDKLMRSLSIALRKRPVEPERVEEMVSKIVRELESLGESEITSETVGEAVMEHLRNLDDVAYVRFASVYRNFREPKDFEQALAELSGEDEPNPSRPSRQCAQNDATSAAANRATPRPRPIPALDQRFMQLALALGRRGLGRTWPNPAVGAVVVKDGVIVGRGWTQPGGRPHAETEALKRAGKAAKGATLYVTLEPCSHQGKTPPCVDAIIRAGIARVVSALEDPNPEVAGQGYAKLRERGIAVETGLGAEEAARQHAGHIRRMREGRPQVLLKLAASSDGKAGLPGRKPVAHHRRAGARARAPDARGGRRHPRRHRHGAVRRSASDLPAAGHDRAIAGARGPRRQASHSARDLDRRHRARNADLGVHDAGRIARWPRTFSGQGRRGVPRRGQGRPARSRRGAQGAGRARHHPADGGRRADGCGVRSCRPIWWTRRRCFARPIRSGEGSTRWRACR